MDNWFEFKNNNAGQVPARGIVRITGASVVSPGRVVLTADQPNSYGDVGQCFVIGPVPVSTGKYGVCTRLGDSGIVTALYDDATGTPAYGSTWGPVSGSFKLSAKGQGWLCLGAPVNTTNKLALFAPAPITILHGTTTGGDIADGSTGTVEVYYRSGSTAYTDSTYSVTALNKLGATVKNGSICEIVPEWYGGTLGFRFIQATC